VQGDTYLGGNVTATGTLNVTGQTTLTTASSTGLTATNLYATNSTITNATSTNFFSTLLNAVTAAFTTLTTTGTTTLATGGGNVGIGNAAPGSLLHVGGGATTLSITPTAQVSAASGSSTLAIAASNSSTNSAQLWLENLGQRNWTLEASRGQDAFNIAINNGINKLFTVLATGNVGIGTTTPEVGLSISGADSFGLLHLVNSSANGTASISLRSADDANGSVGNWLIGKNLGGLTSDQFSVWQGTAGNRMTIDTSGNVGIGTTTPAEKLSIDSGAAEYAFQWNSNGSKAWVLGSATNRAYIRNKTDGTEPLTILNGGNVGIGTTTPLSGLSLGAGKAIYMSEAAQNAYIGNISNLPVAITGSNGPSFYISGGTSNNMVLASQGNTTGEGLVFGNTTGTTFTEYMRLIGFGTGVGNLGIGTTTPGSTLTVAGTSNITGAATFGSSIDVNGLATVGPTTFADTTALLTLRGERSWMFEQSGTGSSAAIAFRPTVDAKIFKVISQNRTQTPFYVHSSNTAESNIVSLVQSGGSVGIGTTTPATQLHLASAIANAGGLLIESTSGTSGGIADIELRGRRDDTNGSTPFGGSLYLSRVYTPGNMVAGVNDTFSQLGNILFGGNAGGTSASNIVYPASMGGIVEGTFTSSSSASTGLVFRTGAVGQAKDTVNAQFGTERMRITSTGNVGIGTTTPGAKLQIDAGTYNANNRVLYVKNSDHAVVNTGYDTAVIQQNDAPTLRLVESGENLSTTLSSDSGVSTLASSGILRLMAGGTYNSVGYTGMGGNLGLAVATSGNVGIGTTTPTTALSVAGDGQALFGPNVGWGMNLRIGGSGGTSFPDASVATTNGNLHIDPAVGGFATYLNFYRGTSGVNFGDGALGIVGSVDGAGKLSMRRLTTYDSSFTGTKTYGVGDGYGLIMDSYYTGAGAPYVRNVDIVANTDNALDTAQLRFLTKPLGSSAQLSMLISADGNVGIGTANPSSAKVQVYSSTTAAFEGLSIQSGYSVSDPGAKKALTWRDGTNIVGSVDTRYDGTTVDMVFGSLYSSGYNTSDRMTIKGNGNVGIGTTNPDGKLDIYGGAASSTNLVLSANYENSYRWRLITADRGNAIDLDFTASNASDVQESVLQLSHSTSGRPEFAVQSNWLIANNGNIGIGTTSPTAKLDIYNSTNSEIRLTTASDGYLQVGQFTNGAYIGTSSSDPTDGVLRLGTAGNERVRVSSTGNVGIGTTTPELKLSLVSDNAVGVSGSDSAVLFRSYNTSAGSPEQFRVSHVLGSVDVSNQRGNLTLQTAGGNVGIGTSTPTQKLDIVGGGIRLDNTGTTTSGVIYKGSSRFLHDFNYGNNGTVTTAGSNIFLGLSAGNFTMGSTATQVFESSYNIGIGQSTLLNNTRGYYNIAVGLNTLLSNTTGSNNTAYGVQSLFSNSTGSNNTSVGLNSLVFNTSGSLNTALGLQAGYGSGSLVDNRSLVDNNMLFLGAYASRDASVASTTVLTNGIAIGYDAKVFASNQAVLGNDSITTTLLKGKVGIGTTTPTVALDVVSNSGFTLFGLQGNGAGSGGIAMDIKNTSAGGRLYRFVVGDNNSSDLSGSYAILDNTGGNARRFVITSTGNIGIGTSTPGSRFDVFDSTSSSNIDVFRIITNVGSSNNVKFRIDSDGDVFTDGGTTIGTPADLAENYPALEALDAGTVVAFGSSTVAWEQADGIASSTQTYDISGVQKATNGYEAVGVISTKAGITLGGNTTNGVPVAFAGRVPVKVTSENGEVKRGDYLTVSRTIPGHAMKLTGEGRAIGRVISDHIAGRDKVMMLIENGYQKLSADGSYASSTAMLTTGNIDLNANGVSIINIKSLVSASGAWSIDEYGKITAKVLCLEDVCINREQLANILNSTGQASGNGGGVPQTDNGTTTDSGTGTSTPSGGTEGENATTTDPGLPEDDNSGEEDTPEGEVVPLEDESAPVTEEQVTVEEPEAPTVSLGEGGESVQ
jgi:hypothetical protein